MPLAELVSITNIRMDSLVHELAGSSLEELQGNQRHDKSRDAAPHSPETSMRRDGNSDGRSAESMGNGDLVLESKHKIFLSHSGAQKDFVEYLCGELERHHHFPFFDKRSSSLPKGDRFPELILKAAQDCQMAVVVISEEYFLSKWPMIELHTFVQTRLKSNNKLKILPLFYKLSVQEFGNTKRRNHWFSVWKEWANTDSRINIDEWKQSVKALVSFNGIEYNQNSEGIDAYLKCVVSNICKEVVPDIKWDDSHVQGRSSMCKVIKDKIQYFQGMKKNKVCMIGFYGVGGIGKTTICKILCNELFQEFEGKVSHVELGSGSSKELLKGVLNDLTNISQELLQQLNEGKCKHLLYKGLCEQKTFLAIDNVWYDSQSIEVAKMYLQVPFHKKSVVMVTSRSLETLIYLGINKSNCFEIPKLDHEDAKKLFLYHATHDKQLFSYTNNEDKYVIRKCVTLCYFSNNEKGGCHYLPLALKALGLQLGCVGDKPSQWLKILPRIRDFNYFEEEHNPVYSVLRSSFDRLLPKDQNLFMDVVLFKPIHRPGISNYNIIEWLSYIYNQEKKEIENQLCRLKVRGLLEDVDLVSQTIRVHELYFEFAKLEAEGKLKAIDFGKRRWVWYEDTFPSELEMVPYYSCWHNLTRLGIMAKSLSNWHNDWNFQGIEWRYCSNIVVLKLVKLNKLQGDLNLAAFKCLRSLELVEVIALDSLSGLEELKNLTYLKGIHYFNSVIPKSGTVIGKLPSSLKVLQLCVGFWLNPDVFIQCINLNKIQLYNCYADILDFSACFSLQSVRLCSLPLLTILMGLSTTKVSILQISYCHKLKEISKIDHLVYLRELHLFENHTFKVLPNLQRLMRLQVFHIDEMQLMGGLDCLQELHQLKCAILPNSSKLSNFSKCDQLRVIDLSYSTGLRSLEGVFVGRFPTLQYLNLSHCHNLLLLEDLSGLENLKKLDLSDCGWLIQLSNFSGMMNNLIEFNLSNCIRLIQLPDLSGLKNLEKLNLSHCGSLVRLEGLTKLTNLKNLDLSYCGSLVQISTLNGLKNLEKLNFGNCKALMKIADLTNLSNLKELDLHNCESLSQLPNINGLRNLEELHLYNTNIELGEEAIGMFAALPLLQSIQVGSHSHVRLDAMKRKVYSLSHGHYSKPWLEELDWEEHNLGMLPVKVRSFGRIQIHMEDLVDMPIIKRII